MQSSYVASVHHAHRLFAFALSRDLAAVILFCLLGLAVSAAWISYLGTDTIGSVLARLN